MSFGVLRSDSSWSPHRSLATPRRTTLCLTRPYLVNCWRKQRPQSGHRLRTSSSKMPRRNPSHHAGRLSGTSPCFAKEIPPHLGHDIGPLSRADRNRPAASLDLDNLASGLACLKRSQSHSSIFSQHLSPAWDQGLPAFSIKSQPNLARIRDQRTRSVLFCFGALDNARAVS